MGGGGVVGWAGAKSGMFSHSEVEARVEVQRMPRRNVGGGGWDMVLSTK